MSRIRAAGAVLLAVHLLRVAWVTLRPRSVIWVCPSNLRPFATIRGDWAGGPRAALEGIGGELLLLAPLGVLLPLVMGQLSRRLLGTALRTTLAGVLIALGIALVQSGVPGQVVNVDAVMLNAAGVGLAHLLVYPLLRAWLRRGRAGRTGGEKEQVRVSLREEGTQAATPRAPRVGIAP